MVIMEIGVSVSGMTPWRLQNSCGLREMYSTSLYLETIQSSCR